MVPSVPALLLLLIPAILMTVSIVREKELGSMINFYVTPTGRLEYLVGKQLPYIAIGLINFFILAVMTVTVFAVPIKGSFLMLTLCTAAVRHGDDRSRDAHVDLHQQPGRGRLRHRDPDHRARPFSSPACSSRSRRSREPPRSSVRSGRLRTTCTRASARYTKGLRPSLMMPDIIFLAGCIPVLLAISFVGLKKQEK